MKSVNLEFVIWNKVVIPILHLKTIWIYNTNKSNKNIPFEIVRNKGQIMSAAKGGGVFLKYWQCTMG